MALTARQRSIIVEQFAPVLGEEVAEALVSQFPSNDLETPATKDFVRAECIVLKSEFREEIGLLRTEMHRELGAVRTEIAELRADMHRELRLHLVATLTFVGALLTAFRLL